MRPRPIDVRHLGREKVICCWQVGDVLVDPGPESCVDTLVEALGDERPAAILLTHIHFDHAGASGALVRRWPDLPVYVHERGARHMADPERLVASAKRLYGEEDFHRLWGQVVPVPEENLRVLQGGERDVEGAFRVEYTPGHASHHVSYLHEDSGWAFVGDVGGVRIPPVDLVVAPTPPPDVDVAAWERSLDLVAAWQPQRLAITHFGEVEDPGAQLEACRASLHEEADMVAERELDAFVDTFHAYLAERADGELATYEQAVPPHHIWLGLDRWHSKQSG
jgi:glyoxylase-like metal-dependent hydrolase (beta-lactamase superfamily II)